MLVTLDFETYYDKQLSLTKMTTMDYVRHEKFKVWGVGIKINHEPTEWYGEDECEEALRALDDAELIERARRDAVTVLGEDPQLLEHPELAEAMV